MMSPSLKYGLSAASLALSLGVVSCSPDPNSPGVEYAPEMYESIPYEPLRQISFNSINSFGINQRTPAAGTVPRGKLAYTYTKANLEEGQVLFTRYCLHCHGEKGDGQGPVGAKFKGVPNYSTGAYKTMNDGHIYHVIEWGRNRMMPHGSQVNPEERWKIAMYVHVLQLNNDPADLPKLVKVNAPTEANSATSGDASAMTDPTNQKAEGKANAETQSETPGQGDKARNGKMN